MIPTTILGIGFAWEYAMGAITRTDRCRPYSTMHTGDFGCVAVTQVALVSVQYTLNQALELSSD